MKFTNLEDANAWIEKAVKEFKSQRRDWFQVNAMQYALGLHGYELAIKDINTLLGDRPRDASSPLPEEGIELPNNTLTRMTIQACLDTKE